MVSFVAILAVVHRPIGPRPDSQYEHSSIAATVKKIFGLDQFLTKRDEWAGTFEQIFSQRTTPRDDCPSKSHIIIVVQSYLVSLVSFRSMYSNSMYQYTVEIHA